MLTESKKARIRAEEVFREEVRQELADARDSFDRKSRIWSFLNSALGLWLLSAVVLSGVGGAVTWWQRSQALRSLQFDRLQKLNAEIECRISAPWIALASEPAGLLNPASLPRQVLLAPGVETGCIADLSDENLASLFDEIARITPANSRTRAEAVAAAASAKLLHARWIGRQVSSEEALQFMLEVASLGAWERSTYFAKATSMGSAVFRGHTVGPGTSASPELFRRFMERRLPSNTADVADPPASPPGR